MACKTEELCYICENTSPISIAQYNIDGESELHPVASAAVPIPGQVKNQDQFGKFFRNEILQTTSTKCEIISLLGQGSFGQVFLAWDYTKRELVAIKALKQRRSTRAVIHNAAREIHFLKKAKDEDRDLSNIIYFHGAIIYKDKYCLISEALEQTLRMFMKRRNHKPLSLDCIRSILKQIFQALYKLQQLKIIHSDLKPDNIMFVNTSTAPYRIKIIDFGNAIGSEEANLFVVLQSLYYRAPEVILGAKCTPSIDTWSVGCIAAELYTGECLYKGNNNYDQMRLICETQGLPYNLLRTGCYTEKYFTKVNDSWVLKTPSDFEAQSGQSSCDTCRYRFNTLDDLLIFNAPGSESKTDVVDTKDKREFVDLVKKMLLLKNKSRIKPQRALQHDFINL